jgi:hypothetical protein
MPGPRLLGIPRPPPLIPVLPLLVGPRLVVEPLRHPAAAADLLLDHAVTRADSGGDGVVRGLLGSPVGISLVPGSPGVADRSGPLRVFASEPRAVHGPLLRGIHSGVIETYDVFEAR